MKNKRPDPNLRNDEILREDLLDCALLGASLNPGGSAKEKAARLEKHYLLLPIPAGWKRSNSGEPEPPFRLRCKIDDGGCGYTSTHEQADCPFCGNSDDAESSTALAERTTDREIVDGELLDEPSTALTVSGSADLDGEVDDLDDALILVEKRKRALYAGERVIVGAEWDLGRSLFEIFKRKLYVQRKKGGVPIYASWNQFAKAELGIAHSTAERYMKIAYNFDRDTACALGVSKLVELLPLAEAQGVENSAAMRLNRAPKSILSPLLERARVIPVLELRAEIRAAMPPTTDPKPGRTGKATVAAAAAKQLATKAPERDLATAIRQEGTATLIFYRDLKAARTADRTKIAKAFVEGMVAVEPVIDGVEMILTIRMGKTGIVCKRDLVRV